MKTVIFNSKKIFRRISTSLDEVQQNVPSTKRQGHSDEMVFDKKAISTKRHGSDA